MTTAYVTALPHRALIAVSGPDWARFLKGLCTAHIDNIVEETARGEFHRLHYGAFLRPQGKMICDVLLHAVSADEIWLDVPLSERDDLLAKLNMYRLRAKVTITALDHPVYVAWNGRPEGFMRDPRFGEKVGMSYGLQGSNASAEDWRGFRLTTGIADPGLDFGADELYPIDANFDLLDAIDFHKGCYVGQELTSRMKRRGQIKNRIMPFNCDGQLTKGAEILIGERKIGEVIASNETSGIGLMRLDRLEDVNATSDGISLELYLTNWLAGQFPFPGADDEYW
ncbi:CAF17-like 4Fe-4S cluster assembly/insertion protein YgfZ [Asticcacaulis sp.]|uniref:CAF17-like 4Fe-4S cluster assembly/insertion protein YgfZ n=1 Tax=Asticcacaulis sp. TaxID=1872648 RepID=UPI003F7C3B87